MLIGTDVRFSRALVVVWAGPALLAVGALLATRRADRGSRQRAERAADLVLVVYAVAVVAITLYPFSFDVEAGRILDRGNWIPFGGTLGFMTSHNPLQVEVGARDFFANVALFAPLGFVLGSRTRRFREALFAAIVLVLMAFALEVVQGLTVAERTLDIDDAIAGSLGALGALGMGVLLPVHATGPKNQYA